MAQSLFVLLTVDKRDLEAHPVPATPDREALVASTGRRYRFDPTSSDQDVGDDKVVRPLSIPPADPGRWVSTEPLRIVDRTLIRLMAENYIDSLFEADPNLPADPPANRVRQWIGKNMAGRLQLRARFPNGNEVTIATQPGP
jgi:hypothetical protein